MNRDFVIPGPETVIWWGVHVPLLSAAFGIGGILLGHFMAPAIGAPLPWQKQLSVVLGGILISIGIAIATGQKPLVVGSWSIGIGFSGITIFQTMGAQAQAGMKSVGAAMIVRLGGTVTDDDKGDGGAAK